MSGVLLLLRHPLVATRDCRECTQYRYDEATGQKQLDPFTELPILRTTGEKRPCDFEPSSCPKGHPEANIELTPENWEVYQHYLRCRAIMRFPQTDPITDEVVAEHAEIISTCHEIRQNERMTNMTQFLAASQRLSGS